MRIFAYRSQRYLPLNWIALFQFSAVLVEELVGEESRDQADLILGAKHRGMAARQVINRALTPSA